MVKQDTYIGFLNYTIKCTALQK